MSAAEALTPGRERRQRGALRPRAGAPFKPKITLKKPETLPVGHFSTSS